jgi:anti-anti-sigma factor
LRAYSTHAFEMLESHEPDLSVRLLLRGELDIAVADRVSARVTELLQARTPVRIEVSDLTFMDSSGFQCLWDAVRWARDAGCPLVVGDTVSPQVRRVITLLNGEELLWPDGAKP